MKRQLILCGLLWAATAQPIYAQDVPFFVPIPGPPATAPSDTPTGPPTDAATAPPTKSPVEAPTTDAPTESPTLAPTTQHPTVAPTRAPTKVPTRKPTRKPTVAPTNAPSVSPSQPPSKGPTDPPTVWPTKRPTMAPTVSPTVSPTDRPSPSPSVSHAPTTFTNAPTISPQPTISPTTKSPTTSPTKSFEVANINVVMRMTSIDGELSDTEKAEFEEVVSRYMETQIPNSIITSDIIGQVSVSNSNFRRRRLVVQPLRLGFNARIRYEGSNGDYKRWVGESFNSVNKRNLFISRLKDKNPRAFQYLEEIKVLVDNEIPDEAPSSLRKPEEESSSTDMSTYIIAGASAAGFLILILIVFLLFRGRQRPRKKEVASGTTSKNTSEGPANMNFAAEIHVERQDDISTLGDPLYGGMIMHVDKDEKTASIGADYDYAKHFLGAGVRDRTSSADNTNPNSLSDFSKPSMNLGAVVDNDVFAEEGSFEDQFGRAPDESTQRIRADVPPGKLGMVIDTPGGGAPVVHAIKPESVLYRIVKIGDRLLTVDGQDVTAFTAVEVSKMISLRSDQHRVLVFLRNNKSTAAANDDSSTLFG